MHRFKLVHLWLHFLFEWKMNEQQLLRLIEVDKFLETLGSCWLSGYCI